MKALILAAGYAIRLYPLTKCMPKPLLPIRGKPIIEFLLDKISIIDEVDEIFIVTNEKFYPHFEFWYERVKSAGVYDKKITVINDKTVADGTKLGAIGDIQLVIDEGKIDDDMIVLGGDNLFEFNLQEMTDYFKRKESSVVALYDLGDIEAATRFGVVEIAEEKMVGFEEKPESPKSTLIGTCCYIFTKQDVIKVKEYLSAGNNPDAPGNYIKWLYQNSNVFGWVFSESWFDIGNLDQFEKANEQYGGI